MITERTDWQGQLKNSLRWLLLIILTLPAIAFAATQYQYTLTGIKNPTVLKNVNDRLQVLQAQYNTLNEATVRAIYHETPLAIRKAMQPYGYFNVHMEKTLTHNGNAWQATFAVTPGPAILITQLDAKIIGPGKDNPALKAALQKLAVKQNHPLNVTQYQKAKIDLLKIAQEQGYIHAGFTKDNATINLVSYQASLTLILDTDKRYYFGPITFINKTPLDPAFLKRFLNIKPGQPYNLDKILTLQSNYNGTGYFRLINILPKIPKKGETTNKIPINIKLDMNKKYLYQIGGGFGTLSGPRVALGMTARWLTPWGSKFNISSLWSQTFHQLEAQYLIPSHDPLNAYYTINGAIYILQPPHDAKAFVKKLGPGYLWKVGKWTFDSRLNYILERWRLSGDDAYTNSHLLQPYINISRLSVANPILVENGNKISFIMAGALKGALSSITYFQPQIQFKIIKTIAHNNRFIFATQDGMTFVSQNENMPLSERFYAGGQNSLLGFKYQSVGPGKHITVANLEYQRRISGMFYVGTFYNIGNAFNRYESFGNYRKNLQRSNGLDLVWRSPLGDITIYWARAISKSGSPNSFGFTLGPEL